MHWRRIVFDVVGGHRIDVVLGLLHRRGLVLIGVGLGIKVRWNCSKILWWRVALRGFVFSVFIIPLIASAARTILFF